MKKLNLFLSIILILVILSCENEFLETKKPFNPETVWQYSGENETLEKIILKVKTSPEGRKLEEDVKRSTVLWDNANFTSVNNKKHILIPVLNIKGNNITGLISFSQKKGNISSSKSKIKKEKIEIKYDFINRWDLPKKEKKVPFWNKLKMRGYFDALNTNILNIKNHSSGFKKKKITPERLKELKEEQLYARGGYYETICVEIETLYCWEWYGFNSSTDEYELISIECETEYDFECYDEWVEEDYGDDDGDDDGDSSGGGSSGGGSGNNGDGNSNGGNDTQIINKLTDPCAKDIFTELENGIYQDDPIKPEVEILAINTDKLNFSEEILHLFASSKETNFTIKNGNLTRANASTDPLTNTTTLSNSYINNATELSIARTMIHEQVHAYINSVLKSKPGFKDMDLQTRMREYARDEGITDIYRFHHEFMGQYVNGIALSLYEWDKDYGNGKELNYITKPDDLLGWNYYKAMAFAGLSYVKKDANGNPVLDSNGEPIRFDTDSFKELFPNENDRNEIKKIISNEAKGNNTSKGTKCD